MLNNSVLGCVSSPPVALCTLLATRSWWIFFTTILLNSSFAWAVTSRGPDVLCVSGAGGFRHSGWQICAESVLTISSMQETESLSASCWVFFGQCMVLAILVGFLQMGAAKWKWHDAVHLTLQGFLSQCLATVCNEWIAAIDVSGVVLSSIGAFCEFWCFHFLTILWQI